MDIQNRKIAFIQEFLKLQNEELLSHLERLLNSSKSKAETLKPMTIEELNFRVDKSMDDAKNEQLTTSNDLIAEMEQWG